MAQKHQTVYKVRSDKSSAAGNKNALALRDREELDGRESGKRSVGYRSDVGVENGL